MTTPRIYISGPMSGLPECNYPAFHAEAARLRGLGYDVVNPAEISVTTGADASWTDYLRADLRELLTCNTVALLPGWHASKGAHLEIQIAHRLDMRIVDANQITTGSIVP